MNLRLTERDAHTDLLSSPTKVEKHILGDLLFRLPLHARSAVLNTPSEIRFCHEKVLNSKADFKTFSVLFYSDTGVHVSLDNTSEYSSLLVKGKRQH